MARAVSSPNFTPAPTYLPPPAEKRIPKRVSSVLRQHGDRREDPYFWMRERDDPSVKKHLEAENQATLRFLSSAAGLQTQILGEMQARVGTAHERAPIPFKTLALQLRYCTNAD